jgi:hypothetical protein
MDPVDGAVERNDGVGEGGKGMPLDRLAADRKPNGAATIPQHGQIQWHTSNAFTSAIQPLACRMLGCRQKEY